MRKNAIEIDHLNEGNFVTCNGCKQIVVKNLPIVAIDPEKNPIETIAVLSWKWDLNLETESSRNVYIACQEAKRQGIKFLFLDIVTINQTLNDLEMVKERILFSSLYQKIPVIAAYDHRDPQYTLPIVDLYGEEVTLGLKISRIMRRPWIFYEIQLYHSNPTKVTYVGYIPDLGCAQEFGYLHMIDQIWNSTLCQTVLYTLTDKVNMYHIDDFRFILPQYFSLLTYAFQKMSRNDFLLTTALLAGNENDRINNDQDILGLNFDVYRIVEGNDNEQGSSPEPLRTSIIYLDEEMVGTWETRHKIYPFKDLKVWFHIVPEVDSIIYHHLGAQGSLNDLERTTAEPLTNISQIDMLKIDVIRHQNDLL